MERLTQWIDENRAIPRVGPRRYGHERCTTQLARYEDTGLTPPEILELKERDTAMEINEIHVDEYYCPACGAENNCDQGVVEDNFCPRCGQRLKRRED